MNPPEPSNHWDSLAADLGAEPSKVPEVTQPDPVEAEIVPPTPDPVPPRRIEPPRPTTEPSSGDWNSVLDDLGLEVSTSEPTAPTQAESTFESVTSLRKNADTIETGEEQLTEVSWETQDDIADDNGDTELEPLEDLDDSVLVSTEEKDDTSPTTSDKDSTSDGERGKRRRGRRGRGRGRGRGKDREPQSTTTSDDSSKTEEIESVDRDSQPSDEPSDEPSNEGDESSRRPRRRRRRGRGSRTGSEPSHPTSEESSIDTELDAQDLPVEDEDESDLEGDERPRHRSVPTWLDAITVVIDRNIESHSKSNSSSRGGSRRGGRGRGRRSGSKK